MANIPTVAWDETSPAGSQAVSLGDDRIREMKTQTREVVGVDHKFGSSGNDADNGKHNKVSLLEQADLGTGVNAKPILGAQTFNSKAELTFTDEDDNDVTLTKAGKIYLDNGRIGNNVNLIARNAADSGNVNLIKANASDAVEIPNGAVLSSSSAPTTDPMIPNKKYVDDKVAAVPAQVGLSNSVSKSDNTSYLAATDGFFIGIIVAGTSTSAGRIIGYTDASNPPTTPMGGASVWVNTGNASETSVTTYNSFCIPVKKGNYYKGILTSSGNAPTATYYFIPLGS